MVFADYSNFTLNDLILRISDYKSKKPGNSVESIGMFFGTKNSIYFYDTGTGKVFEVNSNMKEFLCKLLYCNTDTVYLEEMAEEKGIDIPELLNNIESEDLLKGTEGDKLYSEDTLKKAKDDIGKKCRHLILELTGACNLRCKYCIYSSSEKSFREFNSESMTVGIIEEAIEYMKNHGDEEVFVTFYGGEPLIRFDLLKYAIEYAIKHIKRQELHFGFTTNLTLMTKEIAEYLVKIPNMSIVCSIDGPEDIHDASRVYVGGSGTYKDAIRGLVFLKEELGKVNNSTFNINFNAVYMVPYGAEKLKLIDEHFNNLCKITEYSSYTISYPTNGTIPEELEVLLPKTIDKSMWEWMAETAEKCDSIEGLKNRGILDSLMIVHDRILTQEATTALSMNGCCTPGTRRLYVDTKGDLYACERINKSPKLGNIMKGIDFDSVFSKYYRDYNDKSFEYCANCWAAKICPFCYANRMTTEGISDRAHIHCEQMKLHLKSQFSLYHEILETNPEKLRLLKDVIVK